MTVPLSWKACVKSNPSPFVCSPLFFPRFLSGLFVFRSGEEERFLTVFLAKPHLSPLLSFPAASKAAASNIMMSAKKTLKSSPPSFFSFPSSFFPYSKSREQAVPRCSHTLYVVVCSSLDNDEKRRLFAAALLSFPLFKSAVTYSTCRYYGHSQPGHLLLTVLFLQGRGVSDPLGIWELILHYSQRASERRLDRSSSQIVWGKRTFSHEIL